MFSSTNGRFGLLVASLSAFVFAGAWLLTPAPPAAAIQPPPPTLKAIEAPAAIEKPVYYAGCNAVRAAGRAPLYRGEPGYRPEMDGDNDGIACEPRPDDDFF